jgi:hypothetical protein
MPSFKRGRKEREAFANHFGQAFVKERRVRNGEQALLKRPLFRSLKMTRREKAFLLDNKPLP